MKLISALLTTALGDPHLQRSIRSPIKVVLVLVAAVLVYAVIFHHIMVRVEGQEHSLMTGVYWTHTVMSTLGFGDITFTSDIGRIFSVIVLLLIVLPYAFIRHFCAPWLEAQLRFRAPRELPEETEGVTICAWDSIAAGLTQELAALGIPCVVLELESARAAQLHGDGVRVVAGGLDNPEVWEPVGHRPREAWVEGAVP